MNGKIILVALVSVAVLAGAVDDDAAFRATVEADWAAQEKRAGRLAQSPEAIQAGKS